MSTADKAQREKEIFEQVLDVADVSARLALLTRLCGTDATLRARVHDLLQAHEAPEGFLPRTLAGAAGAAFAGEKPGDWIGHFKLRERIGEGGCGVVYVAEQEAPVRRKVALKVIKLGMDTQNVVARFEAERQALAMMDHPNIAKVLEAGATETGRPYFVMELVRGVKITEYCDEHQLSTATRLELFMTVCQAVQHAHQKGIIHRDLKPSNILVTVNDGRPVPKVIDFGIAKATEGRLTDLTVYTDLRQFIGTPAYMSPEQAMLTSLDIDTRSDIYSLGVLLYELLTGRTPFDTKELLALGADAIRRTIGEREPMRPSTRLSTMAAGELTEMAKRRALESPRLIHLVRGDLDWIAMKCLEKDRARRYETADGLALDIARHLKLEPIIARPPSNLYRLQRMIRRNQLAFSAAGALTAALLLGVGASTWQAVRATRAEREQSRLRAVETGLRQDSESAKQLAQAEAKRAGRSALEAKTTLAASDFSQAVRNIGEENGADALPYLVRSLGANPSNAAVVTRTVTLLANNGWAIPKMTFSHDKMITDAQFSPDGKRIVTASFDNTARIWAAQSGRPLSEPLPHKKTVNSATFSPDGRLVVTASLDETARIWDAASGQALAQPLKHHGWVLYAEFSLDGKRVVTASCDNTARVWDAQSAQPLSGPLQHLAPVNSARFSRDGKRVVTASADQTAKIWDAETGQLLSGPLRHTGDVFWAEFSLDGTRVVTASSDQTARVWDAHTGQLLIEPLRHQKYVRFAAFSPDGKWIVTASSDRTARVWNAQTGEPQTPPLRHQDEVVFAEFSPDGKRVVTAAYDGTARVWDAQSGLAVVQPLKLRGILHHARFSPDGKQILTASDYGFARIWDLETGRSLPERLKHPAAVRFAQFSPDGRSIVTASDDAAARIWDAQTGIPLAGAMMHKGRVLWAQFSADGRRIVTASDDQAARVWDAQTAQPVTEPLEHEGAVNTACFSADGRMVATASDDHTARVWDARDGHSISGPLRHEGSVVSAQFSPDGAWIVTASKDHTAKVWDAHSGRPVAQPLRHQDVVNSARFSPEGKRIVTASDDWTVRVWDALTGQPITEPIKQPAYVADARFSPDGKRIVTASTGDFTAQVWDAQTGLPLTEVMLHQDGVISAQFSADGERILTVSGCTAQVWDSRNGLPLAPPLLHQGLVHSAQFSPDGNRVVTASEDGLAMVWDIAPPPSSCPDWLSKLAESIGGERLNNNGVFEEIAMNDRSRVLAEIRDTLSHSDGADDWIVWGRWFLSHPAFRTISPFSTVTVGQYIDDLIREQTQESLAEAENLADGNSELLRRITAGLEGFERTNRPTALRENARLLENQGKLAEAEAKYGEAVGLAPQDVLSYEARGAFFARCGKWQEATADFSKATELAPGDYKNVMPLALALVQSGKLEAYQRFRGRILAQFNDTNDSVVCGEIAAACLILPLAGHDLAAASAMAETAVNRGKYHPDAIYYQWCKGLAEYRTGHFNSAIEIERKVLVPDNAAPNLHVHGVGLATTVPTRDASAHLLLAMAQWHLNRPDEARGELLKGAEIIDSQMPTFDSSYLGDKGREWILPHALWQEAKELIQ